MPPGKRGGDGSNQYTMAPLTESECVEKFKELTRELKPGGGHDDGKKDWLALFAAWLRTDKAEYPNVKSYFRANGVALAAIQKRGGGHFWTQCRANIHAMALAKALDEPPKDLVEKYAKQLRIISKLEDAIEHRIDDIRRQQANEGKAGPDGAVQPVNPFEVSVIEKLIDGVDKLSKTNVLLQNGGVEKHEVRTTNLHAMLVKAVEDRDRDMGVR